MKKYYNVRWGIAGQPSVANVSFFARSDYEAKQIAAKTGRELGLPNTPYTIYEGHRCVKG